MEIEQKHRKIEVSENKMGLLDCKVNEEMNRVGLNKLSSKRKNDRIMDRFNNSPNNRKYIEKPKKLNFQKLKFCFHNDLFGEQPSSSYLLVHPILYTTPFIFVEYWHI